jgi:prepilin-type N-terminal cleavage/methylation domain-containing protein
MMTLARNTQHATRNTRAACHYAHLTNSALRTPRSTLRTGFTLIEMMVVVGIMAIVMTMGVPMVYKIWRKEPMRTALAGLEEVCSNARARAILQNTITEVVFHPKEGRFEVSGGAAASHADASTAGPSELGPAPGSGLSGQLSDRITIDMLDVNLMEYRDRDEARVRFYPNGTCDELTIILRDDQNQQRGLTLEVTTSLVSILTEADLQNLRNGRL